MTKTILRYETEKKKELAEPKNLKESFEIRGQWQLPENPENQIPGTFKFSPKRSSLDLQGSFEQNQERINPQDRTIVNGIGEDGSQITLWNCLLTESSISGGGQRTKYVVSFCFIGHHFTNENEIEFNRMSIQFSKLNTWIQTHGFDSVPVTEDSWRIEYTPPETITVQINDNLSLSIVFSSNRSFSRSDRKTEVISQNISLNFENTSNLDFFEWYRLMQHLRNFLSLAIMGPEYPISINCSSDQIFLRVRDHQFSIPIRIYYSHGDFPDNSNINEGNMLFTFNQIQENFETIIRNWFDNIDTIGIVGNLYFGTLHNPQSYLNDKFLSIVTALESFHRIFRNGKIWDDKHFQDLQRIIAESVPPQDKAEIKMRFRYANEFTLRRRLRNLIEEFNFVLTNELGFDANFVGLVVDTRNYYAHYDLELREHIIENQNLHGFINRLRAIMEACFLSELGEEQNIIRNIIQKSLGLKNIR